MNNFLFNLTNKEFDRQQNSLNLIASENYPSPKTLALLGSVWSNKYGEGYPNKRYYAGNIYTDELESFVQQKALDIFDKHDQYSVNVQVLSGSPANSTVYLSCLEYGDTILSLDLSSGGHLSHLHSTSNWNKFFKHATYNLKQTNENCFEIDWQDCKNKILEYKPKLLIVGFSSYPRNYDFADICKFAHSNDCLVLADIAHINGLVAAGLHSSPFNFGEEGADFVSMTTHKTFRGPRGALLFAKKPLIDSINKTIFPGTSGGPHFHQIAAVGQSLLEILGEEKYPDNIDFKTYSQSVISNCQLLESSLVKHGLEIISPTQNHLCLVKLPHELDSLKIQKKLEEISVICNRNTLPQETKTAYRPSGLRLGTSAVTSRGINEVQIEALGKIICDCIFDRKDKNDLLKQVKDIAQDLNWWYNLTEVK
jgi:glycine hydroxymethyltransferase